MLQLLSSPLLVLMTKTNSFLFCLAFFLFVVVLLLPCDMLQIGFNISFMVHIDITSKVHFFLLADNFNFLVLYPVRRTFSVHYVIISLCLLCVFCSSRSHPPHSAIFSFRCCMCLSNTLAVVTISLFGCPDLCNNVIGTLILFELTVVTQGSTAW